MDHSTDQLPEPSLELGIYSWPNNLEFKLFDFEDTLSDQRVDFSTPHYISQRNTEHCSLFEFFSIQRRLGDTFTIDAFLSQTPQVKSSIVNNFFYMEDTVIDMVDSCLNFWNEKEITLPPITYHDDYRTINVLVEDSLGCTTDYTFKFCYVSSSFNYSDNDRRDWNFQAPTDHELECFDSVVQP